MFTDYLYGLCSRCVCRCVAQCIALWRCVPFYFGLIEIQTKITHVSPNVNLWNDLIAERAEDRGRRAYLFFENDMLPLPVLHHAEGLQRADDVVRVDRHLLADICADDILGLPNLREHFVVGFNEFPVVNRTRINVCSSKFLLCRFISPDSRDIDNLYLALPTCLRQTLSTTNALKQLPFTESSLPPKLQRYCSRTSFQ